MKAVGWSSHCGFVGINGADHHDIGSSETSWRERETVCGMIAGEHTAANSRGTPTFINLDRAYPNQVFTLLIWGDDRGRVGAVPESGKICAIGVIREYRGTPEIVLRGAHSWYVPK